MDHPHEPLDAIKQWQQWYRKHAVVASMEEPLVSKDSRENLHDTSKATYEMPDWRSFYKELAEVDVEPTKVDDNIYLQKAIEHFSDTLCEFAHELSAEQFYKAFLIAATNVTKSAQDDYLKCKTLVDLIEGNEETKASQLSELDMPQVRRKARCLV
jgi:3-methyladenine DNA glycosylase AlkD